MAIANALRLAGPKLINFLKGDLTNAQLLGRLAPDIAFAGVNMAMTPGGVVEKGTAGITDLAMSGLTGLAALVELMQHIQFRTPSLEALTK